MSFLSVKGRITLGLTCLIGSVLLIAIFMGLGPKERQEVMRGRAKLGESIALNTSIHLSRNEVRRIEALLTSVVQRDPQILSAALRKANGQLHIEVGEHDNNWDHDKHYSTETHIKVPLNANGEKQWGFVEIRFRPVVERSLGGLLQTPWVQYTIVVTSISFCVIFVYLGFVLKQLDPSKAVPKRVKDALNSLAEGLIVTDRKGRVILANDVFASWTGRLSDKLIGVNADEFGWVLDEGANTNKESFQAALPWKRALELETAQAGVFVDLQTQQGKVINLIANSSPVLGHDGQYRGVLTSFEDVTELEQHKEELAEAKVAADVANQAKSEFLARMSHEIRTPMNAILGYTEVLRRGYDDEENRAKHLATIQNSGEHLLSLINDILDLSKIESGQMMLECKRVAPLDVVTEVISVLRIKAKEKGIVLDYKVIDKIPETILTDSVRLKQTLINLIGNAIKFTEQGGVRVQVSFQPSAAEPRMRFDVIDSGIGISQKVIESIFDPFSQADASITRRFGGTGLGLAISRQIIQKMGGDISVASEVGQGSVFTFTIDTGPLEDIALISADDYAAKESLETTPEFQQIQFTNTRVLVVDDGESNRELVTLILRRAGIEFDTAENGQIAVECAVRQSYDVVLMDMHMPVMDGFAATRALRELGYTMPIIALTADVMQDDERKCREAGCSGFLPKPIDVDRLIEMIAQAVPDQVQRPCVGTDVASKSTMPAQNLEKTMKPSPKPPVSDETIVSSLPCDDADFRHIVEVFLGRLHMKVPEMHEAAAAGKFEVLADLAHWLKGSGGTAGFPVFTEPANDLQRAAESSDESTINKLLSEIKSLADRTQMPADCTS